MNDITKYDLISSITRAYTVNQVAAEEAFEMVMDVIKIHLKKFAGKYEPNDVMAINRMIIRRFEKETGNTDSLYSEAALLVQQCIVDVARQETMKYVRSVYYPKSTLLRLFIDMNVDVSGAEACLDSLGASLSPSEKTLLRLLYGEGCTVMQAAGMLGVTPQEVRTIHRQAFASLRQEWLALREALRGWEGVKQ